MALFTDGNKRIKSTKAIILKENQLQLPKTNHHNRKKKKIIFESANNVCALNASQKPNKIGEIGTVLFKFKVFLAFVEAVDLVS